MAKKKLSTKAVVIIGVSIVALVAIIGGSIFAYSLIDAMNTASKKNKKKHKKSHDDDDVTIETTVETDETEKTDSMVTNPDVPEGAADWTVLMYVCGTDLETEHGFASSVFDYIDNYPVSSNINVIAQTGGALKWNNADYRFSGDAVQKLQIPTDRLGRYKFEGKNIVELPSVELQSMGSSKTLSDFISWGVKEYPAKKYMLVIWDHGYVEPYGNMEHDQIFYQDKDGNPVNSFSGADVSKLQADNLNLDEFRQALQTANTRFELVAFNTCLSASVEIASATAPYANYMVASEESIPAVIGIPYDFIQFMMDHPDADGDAVGKNILEAYEKAIGYYVNKYNNQQEAIDFFSKGTMSLINLSCINEMDVLMAEIWRNLYESSYDMSLYSGFQNAAVSCETYGSEGNAAGNLVDLRAFLVNASTYLTNTDADEKIINLIDHNIISVTGKGRFDSNGISFFFPSTGYVSGIKSNYAAQLKINGYSYTEEDLERLCKNYIDQSFSGYVDNIDFIDGYYWYVAYLGHRFQDYYMVPAEVTKLVESTRDPNNNPGNQITSDNQTPIQYKIDFDQNGNFTLNITSGVENVVDVQSAMVLYAETDGRSSETYSYFGNDTVDHDQSKPGVYTKNYTGEWYRLDGEAVHMFIVENTSAYTSFAMPADINGKWAYIVFQKDKKTGSFEISYCFYADPNTGVATNDMFSLKEGDKIEPLYYSLIYMNDNILGLGADGDIWIRTRENAEIVYDGKNAEMIYTRLINPAVDNVVLLYSFLIKDAFGNVYQTTSIEMTFTNGKLSKVKEAEGYKDYSEIVNAINSEI